MNKRYAENDGGLFLPIILSLFHSVAFDASTTNKNNAEIHANLCVREYIECFKSHMITAQRKPSYTSKYTKMKRNM